MTQRKLRSKVDKPTNSSLFDFKNINKLVFRDQPITIKPGLPKPSLKPYNHSNPVIAPELAANDSNVQIKTINHGKKRQLDRLTDSIYGTFHRKMKKEERRMASIDRMKIMSEVDQFQTNLKNLQQHDWAKYLPNITIINDLNDKKELEYKKLLTILEIKRLLSKYESWKKRDDQLTNDVRLYNNLINGTIKPNLKQAFSNLTPEDEISISIDQIKKNRASERRQKYGATITLKLTNGLALVIDPILPPKIINLNEKFSCDGQNIAFGAPIPKIEPKPFSISDTWKSHSNEWKQSRSKSRHLLENT